jgi:hypothetical protein
MLLGQPLLNGLVAGKAFRLIQTIFERLHGLGRDRLLAGLWPRLADVLDALQAAVLVERQPVGYGIAMHTEVARGGATAFGLAAF